MDIKFSGNGSLTTKIDDVDRQHADLFKSTEDIGISLVAMDRAEDIRPVLDEFISDLRDHFGTEEKYFHLLDPDAAVRHRAEHQRLLAAMDSYANDLHTYTTTEAYTTFAKLDEILTKHVVAFDLQLRFIDHDS